MGRDNRFPPENYMYGIGGKNKTTTATTFKQACSASVKTEHESTGCVSVGKSEGAISFSVAFLHIEPLDEERTPWGVGGWGGGRFRRLAALAPILLVLEDI